MMSIYTSSTLISANKMIRIWTGFKWYRILTNVEFEKMQDIAPILEGAVGLKHNNKCVGLVPQIQGFLQGKFTCTNWIKW